MNLLEQIYQAGLKHKDRLAVSQSEQGFTYTQLFQAIHQITQQIKATHVSERPILVFGKNDFLRWPRCLLSQIADEHIFQLMRIRHLSGRA